VDDRDKTMKRPCGETFFLSHPSIRVGSSSACGGIYPLE
jgi:hypothetical protein